MQTNVKQPILPGDVYIGVDSHFDETLIILKEAQSTTFEHDVHYLAYYRANVKGLKSIVANISKITVPSLELYTYSHTITKLELLLLDTPRILP